MELKTYSARSPALRHKKHLKFFTPPKRKYKKTAIKSNAGRNLHGKKTIKSKGFRKQTFYPLTIKQYKYLIPGNIISFVVHPYLYKYYALIKFINNSIGIIPATQKMRIGTTLFNKTPTVGNILKLNNIKPSTNICNIELYINNGAQLATAPGTCAKLLKPRATNMARIRLPSKKIINLSLNNFAQIGKNGGQQRQQAVKSKAGISRRIGKHPSVRGVAMNPRGHPHGGSSGPGRSAVTPWGKSTK